MDLERDFANVSDHPKFLTISELFEFYKGHKRLKTLMECPIEESGAIQFTFLTEINLYPGKIEINN